jgi:hypothetical protein
MFIFLFAPLYSTVVASQPSQQIITFPLSTKSRPVTLNFFGTIYNNENAKVISKSSNDPIIKTLYKMIIFNKTKNLESILSLWNKSERDSTKNLLANIGHLDRNAAFFRNVLSSNLMGYIEYGEFVISYVEYIVKGMPKPYLKAIPLIRMNKKMFLTNRLSKDSLFSILDYELGKLLWPSKS